MAVYRLCAAATVSLAAAAACLAVTAPSAEAASSSRSVALAPDSVSSVTVRNQWDAAAFDVFIDDQLARRSLAFGTEVRLVVDAGPHRIRFGAAADARQQKIDVTHPVVLTIRDQQVQVETGRADRAVAAVSATDAYVAPQRGPVALPSVFGRRIPVLNAVLSILALVAGTTAVIALMAKGRRKVRDERARLRLQLAAQRSLDNLPPLTIGRAARRGRLRPDDGTEVGDVALA